MSNKNEFGTAWKNAPRHTTPSRQTATSVDESDGLRCRVRAAASLFFFLVAQDRKISLSGCLGWAEGALKHHARNNNGDAAIEVLSVISVFVSLLRFRDGWPIEQDEKLGLRPAWSLLRHHHRGIMRYVLWAWLYCSGRLSLGFAFYRLDRGFLSGQESPRTPPGVLTHHGHATSRLINCHIPNYIIIKLTRK